LEEEIRRILLNCEKLGIKVTKKEATAIIAEKSKRTILNKDEISKLLINLRSLKK
jgi:hypothetical protein